MIQSRGYAAQQSTTPLAPFSFTRRDPKEREDPYDGKLQSIIIASS